MSACDCFDWSKAKIVVPDDQLQVAIYRNGDYIVLRQESNVPSEWEDSEIWIPRKRALAVAEAILVRERK